METTAARAATKPQRTPWFPYLPNSPLVFAQGPRTKHEANPEVVEASVTVAISPAQFPVLTETSHQLPRQSRASPREGEVRGNLTLLAWRNAQPRCSRRGDYRRTQCQH